MRIKALVSPLAIVIGLGLAGGAVAQDASTTEAGMTMTIEDGTMMINGAEVNEEQAGYIQSYCNDLDEEFDAENPSVGVDAGVTTDEDGDIEDSELEDTPTSLIDFDLSQIQRDDCIEAGYL